MLARSRWWAPVSEGGFLGGTTGGPLCGLDFRSRSELPDAGFRVHSCMHWWVASCMCPDQGLTRGSGVVRRCSSRRGWPGPCARFSLIVFL